MRLSTRFNHQVLQTMAKRSANLADVPLEKKQKKKKAAVPDFGAIFQGSQAEPAKQDTEKEATKKKPKVNNKKPDEKTAPSGDTAKSSKPKKAAKKQGKSAQKREGGEAAEAAEEAKLRDEVSDFMKSFNYDTSSDISEPEGLDDIDDADDDE